MAHMIELEISMEDEKMRTEAIKIAGGTKGVIKSVTIEGDKRDKLVVVGIGIDPIKLTRRLRKRMGFELSFTLRGLVGRRSGSVKLARVEAVKEKPSEEKKKDPSEEKKATTTPCLCHSTPTIQLVEVCEPRWGPCGLF